MNRYRLTFHVLKREINDQLSNRKQAEGCCACHQCRIQAEGSHFTSLFDYDSNPASMVDCATKFSAVMIGTFGDFEPAIRDIENLVAVTVDGMQKCLGQASFDGLLD